MEKLRVGTINRVEEGLPPSIPLLPSPDFNEKVAGVVYENYRYIMRKVGINMRSWERMLVFDRLLFWEHVLDDGGAVKFLCTRKRWVNRLVDFR